MIICLLMRYKIIISPLILIVVIFPGNKNYSFEVIMV